MKKLISIVAFGFLPFALICAQTLNVQTGSVTYRFPASQAGIMTYSDGAALTVMGKSFTLSDIDRMYVDETDVQDSTVSVVYNGSSAAVVVAGNIARYISIAQSGAHVSVTQSTDLAMEITYHLSGSSSDGEFYMAGSFKATLELDGLTLTNATPVYSGAAVHIQNGKRINVKLITGTTSTLKDAASGSQKGCLYIKGHAEFKQHGTLNLYGNLKHALKTGEYFYIRNATINVLSAVGDGINCGQYFLMESGTINISGIGDDGIQSDIDDTTVGSTGITANHENEDTGNIYISGGTVNVTCTAAAAKGIKAEGEVYITGGTVNVTTSGNGEWDSTEKETSASACIKSGSNMALSGGTLTLKSTGSGGKGIKSGGTLTVSDSASVSAVTTGGLFYSNGSTTNNNYTGNVDRVSTAYRSSPKGIKAAGQITITGGKISVSTSGNNGEGIESKSTLDISGGEVIVTAYDDGINSVGVLTVSGGMVYSRALSNDGIDANADCYINGGLVYAVGASSPEVAIDALENKTLYINGGTLVAIGGLESGASLKQTCYSAGSSSGGGWGGGWGGGNSSSWSKNTWYALTVGDMVFAFKTPDSGGSTMVVSGASTPTLKSGVTPSGTTVFDGLAYYPASVSGGSSVSLSSYSSGSGGGPGGGWW